MIAQLVKLVGRFVLPLFLSACATVSDIQDASHLARHQTEMECHMSGGAPEVCAALPEFGFGDW